MLIGIASFGIMVTVAGLALHANLIHLPLQRNVEAVLITDFSDDRKFMGASHHVFVGKVVKQVGSREDSGGVPETQFSVQVIENIKGNLSGLVTVNQEGGYKNGILYIIGEGDVVAPTKNADSNLLKPGVTYVLATRFDKNKNEHTLLVSPFGSILINQDRNMNNEELRIIAQQNGRVKQLQEAYKNEILLDADVKDGNTPNSYTSLQEKIK